MPSRSSQNQSYSTSWVWLMIWSDYLYKPQRTRTGQSQIILAPWNYTHKIVYTDHSTVTIFQNDLNKNATGFIHIYSCLTVQILVTSLCLNLNGNHNKCCWLYFKHLYTSYICTTIKIPFTTATLSISKHDLLTVYFYLTGQILIW